MTDSLAAFAEKYQIEWVQETITDRQGCDLSPMKLRKEQTDWATLPPMGARIVARGLSGWVYRGVVTGHDADGEHYTVRVTSARGGY